MEDIIQVIKDEFMQCGNREEVQNPKISVIIPAYNSEEYIVKCLDSLIKQTLKDIEIIVVNDGSTDNTYSIISTLANCDFRIKIINQENQKQGTARNRGIEISKGEYIAFVDSDDYVENDYLEKLYDTAQKYDADIVTTNLLKHKKFYNKYNVFYKKFKEAVILKDRINICKDKSKNFFYVINKLYKKSFIDENNFSFPENCYYEDVIFSMKTIYYSTKIVSCPNTIYHYVEHKQSTVNSKENIEKKTQDKLSARRELQEFAEEHKEILAVLNTKKIKFNIPILKIKKTENGETGLLFGLIPIYNLLNKSSRVLNVLQN